MEKHRSDIKKFGKFLQLIKWTLPVLGLLPIGLMLRLMFFSRDFGDKMVYPLIALFLGTGNQTAHVPCAIVERLFDDPNMKLWQYSPDTLLPNLPTMVTFANLGEFYAAWRRDLEVRGVEFRLETEVAGITARSEQGVALLIRPAASEDAGQSDLAQETFDELVLCVLADEALRLLGRHAAMA